MQLSEVKDGDCGVIVLSLSFLLLNGNRHGESLLWKKRGTLKKSSDVTKT